MRWLLEDVLAVSREFGPGIQLLAAGDRDRLRERVGARWGASSRIWERAPGCESVQNEDGWQWISGFVGARPCIIFFNADDEAEMAEIPSGDALESLLANSYHFEFYVTDVDASYLICFNHHDFLIAWGSACPWLRRLKAGL